MKINESLRLFEDFFDNVDAEEISDNDIEDVHSEDTNDWKPFKIQLTFANTKSLIELKNCNVEKIYKKIKLIFENSKLFKSIKCDDIYFYDNYNKYLYKQFDINNLPNNLECFYEIIKDKVLTENGLMLCFKYKPGKKLTFEKFCAEFYKIIRLVGNNSISHPESKGLFIFDIENSEISSVSFNFFNFPRHKDIENLYKEFYGEVNEDDDFSDIQIVIKYKTNLEKCINFALERLYKKEGMKFQLIKIESSDAINFKFVKIKLIENPKTKINVMEIYNNLNLYVLDSIPVHYLMLITVCLVIYVSDEYDIIGLDKKQLNKNPMVHPKKLLKSAEILPVKVTNKDKKEITRGRFVKVSYMLSTRACAYMCIPTLIGYVMPDGCYSMNLNVEQILNKNFRLK